jgi:hypothetical protein
MSIKFGRRKNYSAPFLLHCMRTSRKGNFARFTCAVTGVYLRTREREGESSPVTGDSLFLPDDEPDKRSEGLFWQQIKKFFLKKLGGKLLN